MNTMSLYDLIDEMPKDFSNPIDKEKRFFIKDEKSIIELRKARWIYIKLGEFLNYNIASASSYKTRTEVFKKEVDYSKIEQDTFVCKQMSNTYAYALNQIGIKAVTIEFPQDYDYNHMAVLFQVSSGHQFMADVTLDLKNIKTGMRTKNFGYGFPVKYNIIDDYGHNREEWELNSLKNGEYLAPIDIEEFIDTDIIGYKKYGMYMDTFLQQFFTELTSDEKVEKYILSNKEIPKDPVEKKGYILRYKFEFLAEHLNIQNLDYLSGRDFLKEAVYQVFQSCEQRNFFWFNLKRKSDSNENHKDFATCFLLHSPKENTYYIYRGNEYLTPLKKDEFVDFVKEENWNLPNRDISMNVILDPEVIELCGKGSDEECLE